jgi:hypothetical protein
VRKTRYIITTFLHLCVYLCVLETYFQSENLDKLSAKRHAQGVLSVAAARGQLSLQRSSLVVAKGSHKLAMKLSVACRIF